MGILGKVAAAKAVKGRRDDKKEKKEEEKTEEKKWICRSKIRSIVRFSSYNSDSTVQFVMKDRRI